MPTGPGWKGNTRTVTEGKRCLGNQRNQLDEEIVVEVGSVEEPRFGKRFPVFDTRPGPTPERTRTGGQGPGVRVSGTLISDARPYGSSERSLWKGPTYSSGSCTGSCSSPVRRTDHTLGHVPYLITLFALPLTFVYGFRGGPCTIHPFGDPTYECDRCYTLRPCPVAHPL